MISVKCSNKECTQNAIEFNLMGDDPYVCCGGCGIHLDPYDLRPDPEIVFGFPVQP